MTKFYIVKNGEILYTCKNEKEVEEIISKDTTGELEVYQEEGKIK